MAPFYSAGATYVDAAYLVNDIADEVRLLR